MSEKNAPARTPEEQRRQESSDRLAFFVHPDEEDFDPTLTGKWYFSPDAPPLFEDESAEPQPPAPAFEDIPAVPLHDATPSAQMDISISDEVSLIDDIDEPEQDMPSELPSFRKEVDALQEQFHWKIGAVIDGKYEIKGVIGRGGMGIVFHVWHREWDVDLAVKMPLSYWEASDTLKARFMLEAQVWVNLGLHPNIVQCWYVREIGGIPCVFMDYINGGSLKDWMKRGHIRRNDWEKILDLVMQACDGLDYAHHCGVAAHRDVKPGNMLLTRDGVLHLTDFGIVKHQKEAEPADQIVRLRVGGASQTMTITGADLGTPEYSAPEQWGNAKHVDARADVYALGVILFELCCGRRPFDDGRHREPPRVLIGRHLFMQPPEPRSLAADIPERLAAVMRDCLQKDPEKRPASMLDLRQRCADMYAEVTSAPYPRPVPQAAELRSNALNNRAVSLIDLGKTQDALDALTAALKLDPHHPESLYNKSLLDWRDRRISTKEIVSRLKEAKQGSPRAGLYLAAIYAEIGAAQDAERELSDAIQSGAVIPHSAVWRSLGDMLMAQEKFADAEAAYQRALALAPEDSALRRRLPLARQRTRLDDDRVLFPYPRCLRVFPGEKSDAKTALLTPDAHYALIGGGQGVTVWDLLSGKQRWTFVWNAEQEQWMCKGAANSATSVLMLPDGKHAVSAGSDQPLLRLWNVETGACLRTFSGHEGGVNALAMLPEKLVLFSAGADASIRAWDMRRGACLHVFGGHRESVGCVAVTPDAKCLLSCAGRSVRVWELVSGKPLKRLRGHLEPITALAVSPDFRWIVSGSLDATVRVWAWPSGKCQHVFREPAGTVTALAISPDGQTVAAAARDGVICLWNLATGAGCRQLKGHAAAVTSLAFAQGGQALISASRDRTARIWNPASGECVRVLTEFTFWLETATPAPDGTVMLVGNSEELRVQDLATGAYLRTLTPQTGDPRIVTTRFPDMEHADIAVHLSSFSGVDEFVATLPRTTRFRAKQAEEPADSAALPISLDGRFAILPAAKETLHLLDLRAGTRLGLFKGAAGFLAFRTHRNWMSSVAVTAQEEFAVSNWRDSAARVWEMRTAQERLILQGHQENVIAVAVTPDGSRAVSGSADKTLRLWDVSDGACLRVFAGHEGAVTAVAITPDARYLLSGSADKTLRLWNAATGECLRMFSGHADSVLAVALTASASFALSVSKDRTLRLWVIDADAPTCPAALQVCRQHEHEELQQFKERFLKYLARAEAAMRAKKFATAYTFLTFARTVPGYERDAAAVSLNARLTTLLQRKALREGRLIRTLEGHADSVTSVAVTPDGRFAVSGSRDRTARLWTLTTGTCLRVLKGHRGSVSCVAVSPDRNFAVSGSWDRTLRLWALATGECLKVFQEHEDDVRAVAMTRDGRFALSGSADATLRLWNLLSDTQLQEFDGLVVPLEDAYRAAELSTAKCLRVFAGHAGEVVAVALSADGQYAISGSWDRSLRFWSLTTGKCLCVLTGHAQYVTCVALSQDGRLAVSGGRDGTVRIWSLARKTCVRVMAGHDGYVTSVALTPDWRFVISSGWDHTIRVWQAATGECLRVFERHTDKIEAIALTADGQCLVSGSRDRTVRLWEFDWALAPGKSS